MDVRRMNRRDVGVLGRCSSQNGQVGTSGSRQLDEWETKPWRQTCTLEKQRDLNLAPGGRTVHSESGLLRDGRVKACWSGSGSSTWAQSGGSLTWNKSVCQSGAAAGVHHGRERKAQKPGWKLDSVCGGGGQRAMPLAPDYGPTSTSTSSRDLQREPVDGTCPGWSESWQGPSSPKGTMT